MIDSGESSSMMSPICCVFKPRLVGLYKGWNANQLYRDYNKSLIISFCLVFVR